MYTAVAGAVTAIAGATATLVAQIIRRERGRAPVEVDATPSFRRTEFVELSTYRVLKGANADGLQFTCLRR